MLLKFSAPCLSPAAAQRATAALSQQLGQAVAVETETCFYIEVVPFTAIEEGPPKTL